MKKLFLPLCTLLLFLFLGTAAAVSADGTLVYQSKDTPPFSAVETQDEDGQWVLGCDLGIWKASGKQFYLFLPPTVERSAVTLRYDGQSTAYDDITGRTIQPGETFVADLSEDTVNLYEYSEEYEVYLSYPVRVMQAGEIATVYINLTGGDDALVRINSSHDAVESGSIRVVESDGRLTYEGELPRMKGHGLTSYESSGRLNTKNSYNLNLGDKVELVDGAGKSKKWTMLRIRTWGEYDASGLSYVTAFATYNALVKDRYFNLCARFVDVYINGEYRGVYVLTERMDNNGSMNVADLESKTDMPSTKTKRVQSGKSGSDPALSAGIRSYSYAQDSTVEEGTDITGGYVLEIMHMQYGECGFQTQRGMFVNIKSPAYPTQEEVQYIAAYVQEFENALFSDTGYNELGKHYSEYADMKSYAAQTLIYAYYLNWENYRTSTYMTKDVHGLLKFGPVWDFESGPGVMYDDTLFGVRFSYNEHQQYLWYEEAWKKGDYLHLIAEMNEEMKTILDQMMGHGEFDDDERVIWSFDELSESIAPSQNMNWLRWEQPNTYNDWQSAMKEALEHRYDNWYNNLWNENKYLLGVTAEAEDNGDGTWTLTAETYGKLESDYVVWYKIGDDPTSGEVIGTDSPLVVPADGKYYGLVTGRNNAYYERADGRVFKSKNITMISNVVTSPDDCAANGIITPGKKYLKMLEQRNGDFLTPLPPRQFIMMEEEPLEPEAEEETTAETEPVPTEHISRTASLSDAEWIVMASGIVLLSAVMIVMTITKKKGGRVNASR